MKKTHKLAILVCGLLVIAGLVTGILLINSRITIGDGYQMERDVYKLLRERLDTDELVMAADARYRVLFALGYDEGLIDFRDMAGFWGSLEKENRRRRDALQAGQTVFGLTQYSATDYLDYMASNLMVRLPERLMENGTLSVTDEVLRHFYETHKEERYRYPARAMLEMLQLDPLRADLDEVLAGIERDLQDGEDFQDVSACYDPERGAVEMTIKEGSKMHAGFFDLYELAVDSEPGVVKGPYSLENGVVYFRLLDYELGGITSFDEAIFFVRKDVMDQLFEHFLRQEAANLTGRAAPEPLY